MSARGLVTCRFTPAMRAVIPDGPALLILDCLYQLLPADETHQAFSAVLQAIKDLRRHRPDLAVLLIHHEKKGLAGNRPAVDQGSGSGVLARNYDTGIYLMPHETDGLTVMKFETRHNRKLDPMSLRRLPSGAFAVDDAAPVVKTDTPVRKGKRQEEAPDGPDHGEVLAWLEPGPLEKTVLYGKILGKTWEKANRKEQDYARNMVAVLKGQGRVTVAKAIKGGPEMVSLVVEVGEADLDE